MWGIFLLISLLLGAYFFLIIEQETRRKKTKEKFINAPLPSYVIEDLCSRNLVPRYISECTEGTEIARKDILTIFQSQIPSHTTYSEVTQMFGKYEQYCVEHTEILHCSYQLGTPPQVIIEYDAKSETVVAIRSVYE